MLQWSIGVDFFCAILLGMLLWEWYSEEIGRFVIEHCCWVYVVDNDFVPFLCWMVGLEMVFCIF